MFLFSFASHFKWIHILFFWKKQRHFRFLFWITIYDDDDDCVSLWIMMDPMVIVVVVIVDFSRLNHHRHHHHNQSRRRKKIHKKKMEKISLNFFNSIQSIESLFLAGFSFSVFFFLFFWISLQIGPKFDRILFLLFYILC